MAWKIYLTVAGVYAVLAVVLSAKCLSVSVMCRAENIRAGLLRMWIPYIPWRKNGQGLA